MAPEESHVAVHHQCAACSQLFRPGETLVALFYRDSALEIHENILFQSIGMRSEQQTEKELHSRFCKRSDCALCLNARQEELDKQITAIYRDGGQTDEPRFFEQPDTYRIFFQHAHYCSLCRVAEESISVHTDCFELFERHCTMGDGENSSQQQYEKYRRLWLAGTRRYAWRGMQQLKFPSSTTLALPPPGVFSKFCGFQREFLPEVIRLIQSHSKSHIIWRYCSAIQLARELKSADEPLRSYQVPKVLSWSRDSPLKLVQDEDDAGSYIRFTIDHRGIRSIDRFSNTLPQEGGEIPSPTCVFVVEPIEKLSDAKLVFELGMGRLQIPAGLHITPWSTPDPLHLMNFTPSYPFGRLAAINLDAHHCTGISFFMTAQVVREIHAHSRLPSTHLERFQYLRSTVGHEIAWIYVPLTAQDEIIGIEIRKNVILNRPHLFIIRTKTGTITVGTPQISVKYREGRRSRPVQRVLYEAEEDSRRPLNLIHCIQSTGLMTFIGADAEKQTQITEVNVSPQHVWPLSHAFFSSASLEGVLHAHVFSDTLRNVCKGILFEYDNGSKRAVGQCRLGWDRVQSWRGPLSMFYARTSHEQPDPENEYRVIRHNNVLVSFDSESYHVSEEDGTREENFHPMKGCLNFWFRVDDVEMEIVGS
ncbi:hypothetical protein V8C35DRAFT_290610 [Trichoderma chlorosporum]